MNGTETVFRCLSLAILLSFVRGERNSTDLEKPANKTAELAIAPGVKLHVADDELSLSVKMVEMIEGDEVEARHELDKKNPLKKMGSMMMMVPLVMQLLSLPGAIATIKMSLLRSIFMGKMALIMIIYNALKESQAGEEVVVVRQPLQQHHDHYYHDLHQPEVEDVGWWGKMFS